MTDSSIEAVARAIDFLRKLRGPPSHFDIAEASAKAVKAVLAALPSPEREPMRWQPIESAPKDGTNIILASPERVTFGKWLDNSNTQWPWEGWITPDGPWGENAKSPPRTWMPLPAPPPAQSGDRT